MKKFNKLILLFLLMFVCSNSYSQSFNVIDILNILDEIESIKVLTPLGNQPNPNINYRLNANPWTALDLEKSKQACIYHGGLFKQIVENSQKKYIEKNNYQYKLKSNCVAFYGDKVYLGTDEGIVVAENGADLWISENEDEINNLSNRKINFLILNEDIFFAGTDDGLYISTDDGESWDTQALTGKNVSCIEFSSSEEIFVGTNTGSDQGVYKYDEINEEWDLTSLQTSTNCLLFDNSILYAGTNVGLRRTINGGTNWSNFLFQYDQPVTCIFIVNTEIYIGTYDDGCRLSINEGDFTAINTYLPKKNEFDYYRINALLYFDGLLYAATDFGLFQKNQSTPITWYEQTVKDKSFSIPNIEDKKIKNLSVYSSNNSNSFWVVCYGDKIWESVEMIDNLPEPFNYQNFPNYQCHGYAWHMVEGGNTIQINSVKNMNYTPKSDASQWETNNWDYIQVSGVDINNLKWDKVTPDNWGHSLVIAENTFQSFQNIEDVLVKSKWNDEGPLVVHKLSEHPWHSSNTIYNFWTSKKQIEKDINNELIESQRIGRELYNDPSAQTIVPSGEDITLYVAPMKNHKIHLKSGFHAKSGCRFHAFVKDYYVVNDEQKPCTIPWEEELTTVSANVLAYNEVDSSHIDQMALSQLSSFEKPYIVDSIPCKEEDLPFEYSGKGSGTAEDPYQITNVHQLQEINKDHDGDRYWILMNDIDATETRYWNGWYNPNIKDTVYGGFTSIFGSYIRSLDGRGYKVKNLYLGVMGACLFRSMNCFTLKRIGFENLIVSTYEDFVIGKIRTDERDVLIEECYFDIHLTQSSSNTVDFEWILGFYDSPQVNNIQIKNTYIEWIVNIPNGDLMYPFIYSDVSSNIENCYVTGTINGINISSPYGHDGNIISCFWDQDKIKVTDTLVGKGLGLSTADLMKRSTFESAGWDFDNIWYIDEGIDYPKLLAFKRDTTGIKEFSGDDFIITPNPATDYIEVVGVEGVVGDVKIYDVLGIEHPATAWHPSAEGNVRIDISGLAAGVYFIRSGKVLRSFIKY